MNRTLHPALGSVKRLPRAPNLRVGICADSLFESSGFALARVAPRRSAAGLRRLHRLFGNNPEHRKCRRDLLEFRKRGIFVHRHMRSRSRRSLQVSLQDGCALVGGNLFELDVLAAAAPEYRPSTGSTYVLDPAHIIPEHRHQVPLPIDDGHNHRQREGPPRLSAGHFQGHQVVVRDARRGYTSRRSIHDPRDPVGSLSTVQPSGEVAFTHLCLSAFSLFIQNFHFGPLDKTVIHPSAACPPWRAPFAFVAAVGTYPNPVGRPALLAFVALAFRLRQIVDPVDHNPFDKLFSALP